MEYMDAILIGIINGTIDGNECLAQMFVGKSPNEILNALLYTNTYLHFYLETAITEHNKAALKLQAAKKKHGAWVCDLKGNKNLGIINECKAESKAFDEVRKCLTTPFREIYASVEDQHGMPIFAEDLKRAVRVPKTSNEESSITPTVDDLDEWTKDVIWDKLNFVLKHVKRTRDNRVEKIERFLDQSRITFRGFTLREIFKDVKTVEKFLNRMRMRKSRAESKNKS